MANRGGRRRLGADQVLALARPCGIAQLIDQKPAEVTTRQFPLKRPSGHCAGEDGGRNWSAPADWVRLEYAQLFATLTRDSP
jgi:hypothetical protein